ncbi:hypothetical protein JQ600_36570 [Bradyrhizobium sp. AUGA SZCCT0176]|uniref:hypothetical protein n=1 Tax=Bradyrhizobium sp. AUGA SZCCT0176 TaxID=2807664 RepID=UPI001BA94B40|nr:hypothetical protein [Bradyrhizobium sp. AUGA SZCCT0176]MBR1230407.1 hypothetical protein [Bradyrhizobium sp. AUGA SZCCT0176]
MDNTDDQHIWDFVFQLVASSNPVEVQAGVAIATLKWDAALQYFNRTEYGAQRAKQQLDHERKNVLRVNQLLETEAITTTTPIFKKKSGRQPNNARSRNQTSIYQGGPIINTQGKRQRQNDYYNNPAVPKRTRWTHDLD